MTTIFLSDLARIAGRTRDTVRNMQNRDGTPWDDSEFAEQPRRRYGVRHALALVVCEMLEAQHVAASAAADFVRSQQLPVEKFLADLRAGAPVPRFVVAAYVGEEIDGRVTWMQLHPAWMGTTDEVAGLFSDELTRTGRHTTRRRFGEEVTARRVGGPRIAVASINEAFRLLTARAAAAGFLVDGNGFRKIDGRPADGGAE